MLVDSNMKFVSQRTDPRMALIRPDVNFKTEVITVTAPNMRKLQFSAGAHCDSNNKVVVTVWSDSCEANDLGDEIAMWFSDYLSKPVRLVRMAVDFVRSTDHKYAPKGQVRKNNSILDRFVLLLQHQHSLLSFCWSRFEDRIL